MSAKGEPSKSIKIHYLIEIPKDTIGYMRLKRPQEWGGQEMYTDGSKVSTDKEKDSTDRTYEGTDDQTEGRRATQTTQTTTSTMFGDDETIAQRNESETESEGIPEAEKKFKQLASDEEMARKLQEDWETEEERKRLAEEEATNDAIHKKL
ncbi:hypothetical protein Tco_0296540 [Tanacetum coccineum]